MKLPPRVLSRLALATLLSSAPSAFASNLGLRFPSEKCVFTDKVTGVRVTALTNDPADNAKIEQTHPQWTADNKYIVFRSNRGALVPPLDGPSASSPQAFAVNETSGEIIQLTDDPAIDTGSVNLARKSLKLYYFRSANGGTSPATLVELNLVTLLADSEAGKMRPASTYERVLATLPSNLVETGGFALDADEKVAYVGVTRLDAIPSADRPPEVVNHTENVLRSKPPGRHRRLPVSARPGGIRSIDLATGEIARVVDTDFTMGQVQANPWVSGEIVYCNETGGDAPQRMWTTLADGSKNRPLYIEAADEWVTREAIIGRDEVAFTILGHLARLRTRPTGIAVISLRNDQVHLYGQVDDQPPDARGTGGFWHCNGSPDGHWLVADTFAGNVWLIDRRNGAMTLLTANHKTKPDHARPSFSPDSTRVLIQSGLLSDGRSLDLMTIPVPTAAPAAP